MQSMISNGKVLFFLVLVLFISCNTKEEVEFPLIQSTSLIPRAKQLNALDGYFHLKKNTQIAVEKELEPIFKLWLAQFEFEPGFLSINSPTKQQAQIQLNLEESKHFGREGYALSINKNKITLSAQRKDGISRGLSSLAQLIYLNKYKGEYFIPLLNIKDYASFQHRGLLLDCSRHFFSKDVVLKYIDLLALYKMNVLHWHLTEDQGWRIEIDKYPRLTSVAAWRIEKDSSRYGGFYTKEDIREIVSYASSKNILVIPEIELPGHSQAAIAAYPFLSCTQEKIEVANDWGVFKEIYCAGKDSTFIFLEDVLSEVMELFPSTYIHIGGDEAPKTRWEACENCQKRMRDEGLKDEHELQSYFIKRIQNFLHKNDRELIGWDEILEGGLSKGAIVQSWRGMDGGISAIKEGNMAIMSPTSHAYLDYGLSSIDLEKVYSFNPLPEGISKAEQNRIIGGECNMWTEHVPDEDVLDSKVFPRILAMSEVLWSGSENKEYPEFLTRVYNQEPILAFKGVNYGLESLPFKFQPIYDSSEVHVLIEKKIKNIEVTYRLLPEELVQMYSDTLHFSVFKPCTIIGQASRMDKEVGDPISLKVHPHFGINKKVNYIDCMYSDWYDAGGEKGLSDGVLGSKEFRDGCWQGFWGEDVTVIIDMKQELGDVNAIEMNFYQYNNAWIFIPKEVELFSSLDGEKWISWGNVLRKSDPKERGKLIETFKWVKGTNRFRYIKVKAKNIKEVPDWHEAAGSKAWIFTDEIIIR